MDEPFLKTCQRLFGEIVFHRNLPIQIDSLKKPIQVTTMHSSHLTSVRASALHHRLDNNLTVFKNEKLYGLGLAEGSDTPLTISHNVDESNPSIPKPVSDEITSASVLLCDTAVCFCTHMG